MPDSLGAIRQFQRRSNRPLTQQDMTRAARSLLGPIQEPARPQRSGFVPSGATLSSHTPALGERIGNFVRNAGNALGLPGDRMRDEAEYVPLLGDAMLGAEGARNIGGGSPLTGLGQVMLAGIGAVPGAGDAAAAGIRQGARRGMFGNLTEFSREGNERLLQYVMPDGRSAPMYLEIGPNGVAEISVDPFSRLPNRFGPAIVRDAASQLRSLYPEIQTVTGGRLTGARPGRQQVVTLPTGGGR